MTFAEPEVTLIRDPCTDPYALAFGSDVVKRHTRVILRTDTPEASCSLADYLVEHTELYGKPSNIVHTPEDETCTEVHPSEVENYRMSGCYGNNNLFSGYANHWDAISNGFRNERLFNDLLKKYRVKEAFGSNANKHNAVTIAASVSRSLATRIAMTGLCVYDVKSFDYGRDGENAPEGVHFIFPVKVEDASNKGSKSIPLASTYMLSCYECERNYFSARFKYDHNTAEPMLNGYAEMKCMFTATIAEWNELLHVLSQQKDYETALVCKSVESIINAVKTPV